MLFLCQLGCKWIGNYFLKHIDLYYECVFLPVYGCTDTRGLFCRIVWRKKSSPFVENQIEGRYGVIQAENRAFISIKSNHKRPSIELQRMPSFSVTHTNTSSSLALPVSWNSYTRGCETWGCMLVGGKNIRQPWASSRELISWSSCYWSAANGSSTSASVGHIDGLAIVNLLSQCCMPSSHFSSNIFFCLHRAA